VTYLLPHLQDHHHQLIKEVVPLGAEEAHLAEVVVEEVEIDGVRLVT